MRIKIETGVRPTVELTDADNFREFSLALKGDSAALDTTLRGAGAGSFDGSHAWIDPVWLRTAAPQSPDQNWGEGFRKMIEFAQTNGWTDERGFIRAHLTDGSSD